MRGATACLVLLVVALGGSSAQLGPPLPAPPQPVSQQLAWPLYALAATSQPQATHGSGTWGLGTRPAAPGAGGGDMSINQIFAMQLVMSLLAGEGSRNSVMFPTLLMHLMYGTLTEFANDIKQPLNVFSMLTQGGSVDQLRQLLPP